MYLWVALQEVDSKSKCLDLPVVLLSALSQLVVECKSFVFRQRAMQEAIQGKRKPSYISLKSPF